MFIRNLGITKSFIAAIILASLLIVSVSPVFAIHNRLRQGIYPTGDYYNTLVKAW